MADREPLRTVVLACGNSLRGDDALGPLFLARVTDLDLPHLTTVECYQLQIENALDLDGADLALFVDAAVDIGDPFAFTELLPASEPSYSTHALAPGAVLATFLAVTGKTPPASYLLCIAGAGFDLGGLMSASATANLETAWQFMAPLLRTADPAAWRGLASDSGTPRLSRKPAPKTAVSIASPGQLDT